MKSKIVTVSLACSLSIASLFIFGCSGETYEALEWPDSGLFTQVPDPGAEYGTIGLDLDDTASATVDQITKEDWQNYVEECKNLGYTIDAEENTDSYTAYNEEGYEIDLSFSDYDEDNYSYDININAPRNKGNITWPAIGLATLLPVPPSTVGEIINDSDSQFTANICDIDYDTYTQYVADCQASGFIVDYSSGDKYYDATNENGDSLRLEYLGFNTMYISMYSSEERASWTSDETEIESTAETVETTVSETEPFGASQDVNTSSDGIDPDFKKMLDDYEAFMDEYIEFMQNYEERSSLEALADYADMVSRYADLSEQIDSVDTENLTNAELSYYIEVTSRVSQKLLNTSIE